MLMSLSVMLQWLFAKAMAFFRRLVYRWVKIVNIEYDEFVVFFIRDVGKPVYDRERVFPLVE